MKSLKFLLGVAVLAASPSFAHQYAQDDRFAKVEIKATDIGNGIYMLTGSGGNIGISVGEDGVFMIDNQFAQLSDKIKAAIADISDKPIRYVVNTHWHGDHTGGNSNFAADGSTLVSHYNVRFRLSEEQVVRGNTVPASPETAWPSLTYSESMTVHINGMEAHLFHIPNAHTDGDTLVYFPAAKVLHMGDTLFNGRYPFIDLDSGGNLLGMIEAVEGAMDLADEETKIIPGHGDLADEAALERNYEMLTTVRDRIQALLDEGKSLEEAVAAKPLADLDEDWSWQFIDSDAMVTFAYKSLTPPPSDELEDEGEALDETDPEDEGGSAKK